MIDNLLTIGLFVLVAWVFIAGGSGKKRSRTWSGDTPSEEARRNTRTDANYQGHDGGSGRGW